MDAKNMPSNLLQISSKYGVDTTWNMADYAGNISAQVHRPFEPENMSRTWTIEHGLYVDGRHRDQNGHSQNISGKHYGKPRRYSYKHMYLGHYLVSFVSEVPPWALPDT